MSEMMIAGIELMVVGMSIVFCFLALLVLAVNMQTLLVQRYFPAKPTSLQVAPVSTAANDPNVIAAITAAVTQYRSKHR